MKQKMKQKLFFAVILCLCLMLAGVPAWADNVANANANSAARATAISGQGGTAIGIGRGGHGGQGGQGGQGGTGIGIGGTASVRNVKTGDFSAEIGMEAPDVTITQTFEAADLWKQKGAAVLPGIASPNLMQQFVGGGVPLAERQDRVYQAMIGLFPAEYTTITNPARKKTKTVTSKRRFHVHWWTRPSKSEPKIPPIPFKTEIETEHAKISVALHPWYRNFLVEKNKIRVASIKVINTSLSGNFVPLGVIAVSSRDPGGSPLPLTDDVVLYVQKYFKGVEKVVLFDPEVGRGAVTGSEANSKGGGISTAIANFASFNTLTGGASVGGSAGTVMPVSVFGKCFMAMAPADFIGMKGTKINLTNTRPVKVEAVSKEGGGDGKKAVGSGVVK